MSKRSSKRRGKAANEEKAAGENRRPAREKSRLVVLLACCAALLAIVWFMGVPSATCLSFASNAILRNQLSNAEAWIVRAEGMSGETADTQLAWARVHNWHGRIQQASRALRAAKELAVDRLELSEYEDLLATKQGDMTAAQRLIDRTVATWPRDSYEAYVRCAFQTDRHSWAETTLEGWSNDFPDDAYPDYLWGRLRELQDQRKRAVTAYDQALQKQPDLVVADCRRAFVLRSLREYEDAQVGFARVQRTYLDAVGGLEAAACLEKLGEYEAAWKYVEPLLDRPLNEVLPQYVEAEELMKDDRAAVIAGRIRASQKQDEEAVQYLQAALDYNPRNYSVRGRLAASLRRVDRIAESDKQIELQQRQARYQAAARKLQVRLEQEPTNHNVRCQLAQLFIQCDSLAAAEYHVHVVLSMDPKNKTAAELVETIKKERQRQRKLAHRKLVRPKTAKK